MFGANAAHLRGVAIVFLSMFLILIFCAAALPLLIFYNQLVNREERLNEAWAELISNYRRKLDLIPPLLDLVRAVALHEQESLRIITEARIKVNYWFEGTSSMALSEKEKSTDVIQAQDAIESGLKKIYASVEQYPDLKANTNYLLIQRQLQETEDQLVQARQRYNQNVREYNSALRMFPSNLMAALFRFENKQYWREELAA